MQNVHNDLLTLQGKESPYQVALCVYFRKKHIYHFGLSSVCSHAGSGPVPLACGHAANRLYVECTKPIQKQKGYMELRECRGIPSKAGNLRVALPPNGEGLQKKEGKRLKIQRISSKI